MQCWGNTVFQLTFSSWPTVVSLEVRFNSSDSYRGIVVPSLFTSATLGLESNCIFTLSTTNAKVSFQEKSRGGIVNEVTPADDGHFCNWSCPHGVREVTRGSCSHTASRLCCWAERAVAGVCGFCSQTWVQMLAFQEKKRKNSTGFVIHTGGLS